MAPASEDTYPQFEPDAETGTAPTTHPSVEALTVLHPLAAMVLPNSKPPPAFGSISVV